MRLSEIRWASDPTTSITFHRRLTVLCDLPHDPGRGSIGAVLASLPDTRDGVVDLECGGPTITSDASEGVVRLDAEVLADAWRRLAWRRRGEERARRRAELERAREAFRQEAVILGGRVQARERARNELVERRGALAVDVEARRAEIAHSEGAVGAVEAALRGVEDAEGAEVVGAVRPAEALAERWIDRTTAIAFLGEEMPAVRTFAEAEEALASARPDQRREDRFGPVSVADAEQLHRAHDQVARAQERAEHLLAGRGARRALAVARAEEREVLDRLGFTDYTEYMRSVAFEAEAPDFDEARNLDEAERSAVHAAEERLAHATTIYRADLERWGQLRAELAQVRTEVRALLGGEPTDDPLRALQAQVVTNRRLEEALAALGDTLARVGTPVPEGKDQAVAAREWLDQERRRRGELAAALARLEDRAEREGPEVDERIAALQPELDALAAELAVLAARIGETREELAALDDEPTSSDDPELAQLTLADVDDTFALALPAVGEPEAAWPLVVDHALDGLAEPVRTKECERLATRSRAQQVVIVTDEDSVERWARQCHAGTVARWPPAPSPSVGTGVGSMGGAASEPVVEEDTGPWWKRIRIRGRW